MTPEEQRIAIAEACGWKIFPATQEAIAPTCAIKQYGPYGKQCHTDWACIPDYLNDLNAMAQAEKVGILHSNELTLEYFNQLSKFMSPSARSIQDSAKIFCATAAQRAEAFLRTIGKWKD